MLNKFPLLRRFSIASLVAMLVTAIVLVFLYRQDQLAEHEQISAQRNKQAATQLIHFLGNQIDALALASEGLDMQALRNNRNIALFPSAQEMVRDYDILKLKIYNRSGTIIYSSAGDEVGGSSRHPDWQAKALSGETTHKLEFRDTFLGATGERHGIYLEVTNMPLVYAGKRIGVVEIYRDATPIFEHLKSSSIRIPLIVFGGFTLLYAALFFYVRRTDRAVAEWQRALLESESRRIEEAERQAHLHFFENMDRINRAIQGTNDLEQMMRDVLDVVLSIFDCDRAFLVYSCDPDMVEFRVPMECTRPEYPGALALGMAVPMDKEMAGLLRTTLDAAGPVRFGPGAEYPLPQYLSEQYSVKSELAMALYPKQDKPWQFGIHQCSRPRVWSHDDEKLFHEIGRRLEEGLTSLLMHRNLQVSEQKFRSLAENMPDTLIRYDRESRRTYINPALIRISAVRDEQMIGLTQQESNPFTMPEIYRRALEHTLATGERSELELAIPTPSGDVRTNLVFIVAERAADGQISGAITIGHDITERKQAEKELLESESRFRSLFESATDCMLILDMDGRIVDINGPGHERLGYTKQEMLGRRISEFDTPEYAATVPERMAEITEDGKSLFESAHVCKDGTIMPVEINTRTIQLDGEQRYFSVIRDITERKRAEQQLRKLSAYLQTVREEEKVHLAREVHDELGSILSALKIEIYMLDKGLSAEQKEMPLFARVESMVELFDEAVKATRRVVTDLRPTVLDSLGLMAALEWQAEQFRKHTGIECRIACIYRKDKGCEDCKDCEYTQDKTLSINLFRIFQESLTNVARHSGASSVEVELQPCDREVVLSISDNGCGLPEGHAIAPTSNGMRGMRERVEQLSGKIEFDKSPDGGLCVMVKFPQPAALQ